MIKWSYILILCCFLAGSSWAQEDDAKKKSEPKEQTWKKEKDRLIYERDDKYKGPDDWSSSSPTDIRDERYVPNDKLQRRMYGGSGSGGGYRGSGGRGTMRYKPQQIQRQRQKTLKGFNKGNGSGNGNLKKDPKVKRPNRKKSNPRVKPKRSSGSSSSSSSSSRSSSGGSGSSSFWTVLLIIIVTAVVVTLLYFMLRNKKPKDTKVVVDVEDEWNPEVVTKTELELKLEAAQEREDFRECVRIYFTFILKELIKKGWIRWKKEKTNHHYVMEMGGRDGSLGFMECVRIYDLVWYGEYEIDRDIFEMLQPTLLNYYKSLDPSDE
ncbi:MAG: hypothetical protein ACFHU9_10495 [Fluviicola sp.]